MNSKLYLNLEYNKLIIQIETILNKNATIIGNLSSKTP